MYYFVCICQLKASSINRAIDGEKQSFRKKIFKSIHQSSSQSINNKGRRRNQTENRHTIRSSYFLPVVVTLPRKFFFITIEKKNEQKIMSIMYVSSIHVLKGVNFAQIFKHGTISVISWEFKIALSSQIQFQKTYWAQSLLQNKS